MEVAMKFDRILVPLDGSPLSEAALELAADLARQASSTIVLLRAAEAHVLPGADPTDEQVRVVGEAEAYLARAAQRLRAQGIKEVETSVWYGAPATSIAEAARVRRAGLIVMSSHGRSGFGRLVLGSVAESVLRSTTIPILLVRAPGAPLDTLAPGAPAREASGA
jgi:nucleotide-binding universal stress UspA family protein